MGRILVLLLAVVVSFSLLSPVVAASAEEAAANSEPQRALKRALEELKAFQSLLEVKALLDKNNAARARIEGLQRALNGVHHEISGQMREAALANARDTAFHAVSLTRELGKLDSLNKVAPDIKALADSSPVYKTQYEQWERSIDDGKLEVSRNVARYLLKISRFKQYPVDLREAAFRDLERENGQSELGRLVVNQIHKHVIVPGVLTRDGVLADFRSLLQGP